MHKRSLLWLSLAIAMSSSGVAWGSGSGAADYVSAFGSEWEPEAPSPVTPAVKGEDAEVPLRSLGSFPVRVRRGDKDGMDWANVGARNYVPKPVVKRFKAGACAFRVSTGDLGLTRYEFREDTHEVSVNTDPVLRFSTFEVSATQGLLVSINAELFVAPLPGSEQACKDKFLGRRVRFGEAGMGLTQLALQRDGASAAELEADVYMPQSETPVYLTWDEESGRLVLVSRGGLTAAVQSPVFLVKPRAEGDYYLTVSPKLCIERTKKR